MNVENINVFILAGKSVLKQACGIDASVGKPYLKKSTFGGDAVSLFIGITGDLKGQVILNMSSNVAKQVASALMGGFPVVELDEMSKSAVSELGNMILGNSATNFSQMGVKIDITPPSLVIGDNITITPAAAQAICVPIILCENAIIEMDIIIKE